MRKIPRRFFVLSSIGGALPFILQWTAEISSQRRITIPDEYLIFLTITFMTLGPLAFLITAKSREFSAILAGISAPSLFFALATGNHIGNFGSETPFPRPKPSASFEIISRAHAFGSGGGSDGGSGGVEGCTIAQREPDGSIATPPDGRMRIWVQISAADEDSREWEAFSNLYYLIGYRDVGTTELNYCVLRHRDQNAIFLNGYLETVSILGADNQVTIRQASSNDAIAFLAKVKLRVSFFEGLWWRLGGNVRPQITVVAQKFFDAEEFNRLLDEPLR